MISMSFINSLLGKLNRKKRIEAQLVLLGSSTAGKSTLIKFLSTSKPVLESGSTTLGIDVKKELIKIDDWSFTVIEVGGQKIYQNSFWSLSVSQADCVIYVIDSTIKPNQENFQHIFDQFQYMLQIVENEIPIIVLMNKQDLVDLQPLNVEEAFKLYGMDKLNDREIQIVATSAKYGDGVENAIGWVAQKLIEMYD
jgi:small GTP-binding protein